MTTKDCWYRSVCKSSCYDGCVRFNAMKTLCELSNIPKNRWKPITLKPNRVDKKSFETLEGIKNNMTRLVADGKNLMITSSKCGNGKTSWAINMMLNYFNQSWHDLGINCGGVYVNVPNFLFSCKANISNPTERQEELQKTLLSAPLVIWDDIVSSALTQYEYQILLSYIDRRMMEGKANLFTSNASTEDAIEYLGTRLYSRVYEQSWVIELKGDGQRGVRV